MSKLVTIYGGSGFVGRYIAQQLAQQGWRVRVAVRRPNEAIHVKPYGVVGQVEPVLCNIRDDDSVRAVMQGADAVVNCVGILAETGKNKFGLVQHYGAERVARIAADLGVARMVQISAIGADAGAKSIYAETKGKGEAAVLAQFPDAVILRPSIIFGPEDGFFNRFAGMARFGPVLPMVGAGTRFQPVFVEDVARAAVMGVEGTAKPGIYELGGPDVKTFRELMQIMLAEIRRKRILLNVPFFAATIMGGALDFAQALTLGVFRNTLLTRDQVQNLKHDNVVSGATMRFEDLGITPTPMGAVLPTYLYAYRPGGQYDAIRESAQSFRKG
ncbi:complex I NDUFA9 subunit family protein [Roseicitreum antarcticum]|uniref:NADH dehydrogenase n=1 Tax=Roseicitreum antarcticum TaxID=564137 RepID=A0A1H3AJU5_9RHOB|nr:complex I NDUFA9 subunit family protein [Roseicitreum antarcticum]SDX29977.1 NADH dehydrogenase [Roseicitreum antarcticum]